MVRMSALHTSHHYTPGNIPSTDFCYRPSLTQGHNAARIVNENSNDTIGNRTHDLLACSNKPKPTLPPCTTGCQCLYCCDNFIYKVTTAMLIKFQVFCNTLACQLVNGYWRLLWACWPHLQGLCRLRKLDYLHPQDGGSKFFWNIGNYLFYLIRYYTFK